MFTLYLARPSRRFPVALLAVLGTVSTTIIAATLDPITLRAMLSPLYGTQTALFLWMAWRRSDGNPYQLMRPSLIFLAYIGVNCALGAALYHSGNLIGRPAIWADEYRSWTNLNQIYGFISASLTMIFLVHTFQDARTRSIATAIEIAPSNTRIRLISIYGIFTFLALLSFSYESTVIVASRTLCVCGAAYVLFRYRQPLRWLIIIGMIAILALSSFDSKRNAIFLLLPVALLETLRGGRISMSVRKVILLIIFIVLTIVAVITMSILRGYGNYNVDSALDALKLIPNYLGGDRVFGMLGNNFEFSYMFFTIHHSVGAALSGAADLELGATYLRVLFVGIPYEVFMYRPPTIVDSYTSFAAPEFRAAGGSWPPSALGEAFWNFGMVGIIVIPILCIIMDSIYRVIVVKSLNRGLVPAAFGLSIYMFLLFFMRGSGFDMFWAYTIVAFGTACLLTLPLGFLKAPVRQ
ncbi:MAG: hypothetical protein WBA36_08405 [Mesorhizobium sp.]